MLCVLLLLLKVLRLVLFSNIMVCPEERSTCSWEDVLLCLVSVKSRWLTASSGSALRWASVQSFRPLLKALKSPAITVELSVSPFRSVSFYFVYLGAVRETYLHDCHVFLMDWSFFHYKMSFFNSSINFYCKVCTVWYECSHSSSLLMVRMVYLLPHFYFLFVSLNLQLVSYRHHIVGFFNPLHQFLPFNWRL